MPAPVPVTGNVFMSQLQLKPFGTTGKVHQVTPASAGWRYVGFSLYRLRPGETAAEATGTDEVILVMIEGKAAFTAAGNANTAKIFGDIQDYHASPEQAAESAKAAGAQMLVLSHLVPPLPLSYLYPAFLGDAKNRFDGPIVVGEDGMLFSLPPKSKAIERRNLM